MVGLLVGGNGCSRVGLADKVEVVVRDGSEELLDLRRISIRVGEAREQERNERRSGAVPVTY